MYRTALETHLPYPLLALMVLALFYGIYFTKQLRQKRRGIQARQIGRRKEKTVHTVEMLMQGAALAIVPAQLVSIAWGWSCLPANARFTGFCIGLLGDGIFLLSVLCMRDSWRAGIPDKDQTRLVTTGLYRFSRNPAFLGFDCMYVGVLLLYCNPLTAVLTAYAVVMLHLQILQGGAVSHRRLRRCLSGIPAACIPLSGAAVRWLNPSRLLLPCFSAAFLDFLGRLCYAGGTREECICKRIP